MKYYFRDMVISLYRYKIQFITENDIGLVLIVLEQLRALPLSLTALTGDAYAARIFGSSILRAGIPKTALIKSALMLDRLKRTIKVSLYRNTFPESWVLKLNYFDSKLL